MGKLGRWRRGLALAGLTCCLAQSPTQPEFKLKAKLLMRIADYTDWPRNSSVQDKTKPFVIGIIGRSMLTTYLEEERRELQALKGKPIEIMKLANLVQVERCQVLFICESEFDSLEWIMERIRNKPILTIGDTDGFAIRGVMVNVMLQQNRLAYEMNLASLRSAGLSVESRVQARAILVGR